jgi:hypothetical protein
MYKKFVCLLILALFVSGCAREALLISQPSGALVAVDGEQVGVTPCAYEYSLSSGESYEVVLSKPGYRTVATEMVADQHDPKARKRWLAAGLVWSPLWLGTLFTKRLEEQYVFTLEEDPSSIMAYSP